MEELNDKPGFLHGDSTGLLVRRYLEASSGSKTLPCTLHTHYHTDPPGRSLEPKTSYHTLCTDYAYIDTRLTTHWEPIPL